MSDRDELFQLILGRTTTKAVERILAAGYRKPRTITTVEELDDLGRNSAILAGNGTVWVNDGDSEEPWACVTEDFYGGPLWANGDGIHLPVTVLHKGDRP